MLTSPTTPGPQTVRIIWPTTNAQIGSHDIQILAQDVSPVGVPRNNVAIATIRVSVSCMPGQICQ